MLKGWPVFSAPSVAVKAFILAVHNSARKQKGRGKREKICRGSGEGVISMNMAP